MVTEQRPSEPWGPRPGEDWRAHRMRVFADHPEILEVLRIAESPEHEAEIWRERAIAKLDGDPEMQELYRTATIDYEASPEEDEADIRRAKEQDARGFDVIPAEVVLRELAEDLAKAFPDRAEEFLNDTF